MTSSTPPRLRCDQRDVHVVALALVKVDGELGLADDLGQAAGGRHVSRDQRGQRGGVDALELAGLVHELAVLVDGHPKSNDGYANRC